MIKIYKSDEHSFRRPPNTRFKFFLNLATFRLISKLDIHQSRTKKAY